MPADREGSLTPVPGMACTRASGDHLAHSTHPHPIHRLLLVQVCKGAPRSAPSQSMIAFPWSFMRTLAGLISIGMYVLYEACVRRSRTFESTSAPCLAI